MISLLQAKTLALASIEPGPIERLPLLDGHGRYLAEGLFARRGAPPFDNSAMDGFAVSSADLSGAKKDAPRTLKIVGELFAGSPLPDRDLAAGEAMRIFTGAPMPFGADAVIKSEHTSDDGHRVVAFASVDPGKNVRRRGEEYREGDLLLAPGTRLEAVALAMCAGVGLMTVPVRPWPRVALLTVGDELAQPGQKAQAHQIFDTNATMLAAYAVDAGAEVIALEHCADRDDELMRAFERLLPEADLVVTAGGAANGKRDRVKGVLQQMGATLGFDGVAIRPGKPVGLGLLQRVPIAILPGNPLAAALTFDQLVRPMILKRLGVVEQRRRLRLPLEAAQRKAPGLTAFIPARVDGQRLLLLNPAAGPLRGWNGAEGWAVLPADCSDFAVGDLVDFEAFHPTAFQVVSAFAHEEDTR
jgi:molybdopterin molybdotransferase